MHHAIWKVASEPHPLGRSSLEDEQLLEDMIVANPRILHEDWMLIGQQVRTGSRGAIDLLAIAPDCSLVLIELKRDRTPRDVVAQALDYASWVDKLTGEDVAGIYGRFKEGQTLDDAFRQRFGHDLDEAALNKKHQVVVVASHLDESTERIIEYLRERGVKVNVLFFQVFSHGSDKFLSRAWLADPTDQEAANAVEGENPQWNGEYYVSFGDSDTRSWEDAREFGFISGGGGAWYSRTLLSLKPNDRIWVKVPGIGFVGVARVTGPRQPAKEFKVKTPKGKRPVLKVAKRGHYLKERLNDSERCEYFVPVRWLQTVPLNEAVHEIGMFGNQNTVCQPTTPTWQTTVDRLKVKFPRFAD